MFLAYVDESGKPQLSDPRDYVLSAFIVHERDWKDIDKAVNDVKRQYFPKIMPHELELHAIDILHRKRAFRGVDKNQKYNLFANCYSLINESPCHVISVVIRKKLITKNRFDCENWGFRLLFERFERFLEGQAEGEYGLMLIDSVTPKIDKQTRKKIMEMCLDGTKYRKNQRVLEDPIFVYSHHRNMSQLADLVAFCVGRIHRPSPKPNITDAKFGGYYKLIQERFHRNPYTGEINGYGLKIFPG